MPNPQRGVETLRTKVKEGERDIDHDRDRDILLEFSDQLKLLRETYGHHRHLKLLRHCVRMAELAPASLADSLEDRDATEDIVRWIHDTYDLDETPETNQNYRVALRVFGRRVTDVAGDDPPPAIAWVNSTLPNDYDPSPDPGEMLRWEDDVEPMLDQCRNSRDEAAIALQFDAGLRGGELYDLCVDDINTSDYGLTVSADGKTGQRAVDLIPSTPHINRWLSDHPGDGDDPLWCKLSDPDQLSYQSYLDMFKRPASRAGVEKDVTPTAFRKSNLAWLCRQGMNARHIERRQGRVHGSDAVSRYAAIFDDDIGDEYAQLMGLEVVDDSSDDEFAPVTCPRCDRETPQRESQCMWCGQALSPEATKRSSQQDTDLMEALADNPEMAEEFLAVKDALEDNPLARRVLGFD
ncbi:tyrosine-type recombinase/integrase [Haloarcula sp. 1CSR25-25]|uniref:tyrosine-type recombinase/integrase n=1 Tax=Haloarcula sp. 1CSR25-25 TaxID=2862545 RepID=UPI0028952D4B|nr:tyrosine-type recombinase/integrase [Haloarcula sp. 1CSR25-25]MDT3434643.1 site-specific integrase [Haloarcula sp. 1CSR25-25]